MNLIFNYPTWFVPLCIVLGLGYAWILYRFRSKSEYSVALRTTLFVLRSVAISVLAILLLGPLLKMLERTVEKPLFIVSIDQSESMVLSEDSTYLRSVLPEALSQLQSDLSNKYDVVYHPSIATGDDYTKVSTDISELLQEGRELNDGRAIAGQILISDGILNQGSNPIYSAGEDAIPVFVVPFGDTTVLKDGKIYSMRSNSVAFVGNRFPVEVVVRADKAEGEELILSLSKNGALVNKEAVAIENQAHASRHLFYVDADTVGQVKLQVQLQTMNGEMRQANNLKTVYVDVLDVKKKILVLGHGPHPDIGAIRSVVEANEQYDVDVKLGVFDPLVLKDYDLVITHQMPVNSYELNTIRKIKEARLPQLYIIGSQTRVDLLNSLDDGLTISGFRNNFNQAQPSINADFSAFVFDDELSQFFNTMPPLTVPFGEFTESDASRTLMYQRIGTVDSKLPLLFFNQVDERRIGFLTGEGIWRWKLYDFEKNENHSNTEEFIEKCVQYLSLKDDRRKFKTEVSHAQYNRGETVFISAELFNDSYEPITTKGVKLSLVHESGEEYNYTMLPSQTSYVFSSMNLPAGAYSYVANVEGTPLTDKGRFVINDANLEQLNLTANWDLLRKIATNSGGRLVLRENLANLPDQLAELPGQKSISRQSVRYRDLINEKWLFFVLIGFLFVEWFARRWSGSY